MGFSAKAEYSRQGGAETTAKVRARWQDGDRGGAAEVRAISGGGPDVMREPADDRALDAIFDWLDRFVGSTGSRRP